MTMYGSGSKVEKRRQRLDALRTLRRMSRRLSGVTSSLKGSLARSPRSSAMRQRRKNPPSAIPPVPSYDVRLLVSPCG
jgi:hypothetical protein